MSIKPELANTIVKGIVLTRHAITQRRQMSLHYYIKTADGVVQAIVDNAEVVCFCAQQHVASLSSQYSHLFKAKPLSLQSFAQERVSALYLKSPQQLRELVKVANDLAIPLYETDIRPEQRYLIERFISLEVELLGRVEHSHCASFNTMTVVKARKPENKEQHYSLTVVSLDFECSFDGELYSVGLYGGVQDNVDLKRVIMVGEPSAKDNCEHCDIHWVENEAQLIRALIDWFAQYEPDIIIGWAVVSFDLALLSRRAQFHNIALNIGRNGALMRWKVDGKYRPETLVLPGRVVLDGIDWLKAAFYQFDSFSLEFVSRALLEEGKAIKHVEDRGAEISQLFATNKAALAIYNITDCRLVWDIFAKTQLLAFALERSRLTGLELGRVGASVAAFNHLYLPHLHRAGYVAPAFPASKGIESPGGYVMDSIPGHYHNVLVLDFKSLYPSIIRTFLIDPKGLIEGLGAVQQQDCVEGFLGAQFSRESPILPTLIARLSAEREQAKLDANAPLSQAIKIIMNSLYGVLGSTTCVFHDAKLASSITMRGHQIMKLTKSWIEDYGYQVIYGDTDSTFVWLENAGTEEQVNRIGRLLSQEITAKWQHWCREHYQLDSYLELEFETHFNQFIMPTLRDSALGSKKRYVGAKNDDEGQMNLTFKGMEQVRSDWTPIAKHIQYQVYYRFFAGQDVVEFIKQQISELKQGKNNDMLVFSKRLRRDVEDYTAKSSPHVKAATMLAEKLNNPKLTQKGTQIKYVMTTTGATPIELNPTNIDIDYYIEKQIRPVVEPILNLLGHSIDSIMNAQMVLI